MLRLIGWCFKFSVLVIAILIAGNLIEWDGKTVSDHVQTTMAQVNKEPARNKVRKTAGAVTRKAMEKIEEGTDAILGSERAKLRALIRELNN